MNKDIELKRLKMWQAIQLWVLTFGIYILSRVLAFNIFWDITLTIMLLMELVLMGVTIYVGWKIGKYIAAKLKDNTNKIKDIENKEKE